MVSRMHWLPMEITIHLPVEGKVHILNHEEAACQLLWPALLWHLSPTIAANVLISLVLMFAHLDSWILMLTILLLLRRQLSALLSSWALPLFLVDPASFSWGALMPSVSSSMAWNEIKRWHHCQFNYYVQLLCSSKWLILLANILPPLL